MDKSDNQILRAHLGRGDIAGVRQLAAAMKETYSEDPAFWMLYAKACFLVDDYAGASSCLDHLQAILQSWDGQGLPQAFTETLAWKAGKLEVDMLATLERGYAGFGEELVDRLERLEQLNPEDPSGELIVIHSRVQALMGLGRYKEALAVFRTAEYRLQADLFARPLSFQKVVAWLNSFREDPLASITPFRTRDQDRHVLVMVVWGESYLATLERFTLPSLLAPGNLPHLARRGEVRFVFLVPDEGARRLEAMPVFQAARKIVTCDLIRFPDELLGFPDNYKLMSTMHVAAMEIARASRSHFYFLAPDIIVANNFLKTLDARRRNGKDVVFVAGLMLETERFGEDQSARFPADRAGVLDLAPGDLLTLGLRHLHDLTHKYYFYKPSGLRGSCSIMLWPLANGGCVAHGFHHSPYCVSARAMTRFDGSMFFTIDSEFLVKIIKDEADLSNCVLIDDARETNYFELSKRSRPFGPSVYEDDRIARWGLLQGLTARWLFKQKVRFDPGGGLGEADPAYAASTALVQDLQERMEILAQAGFPRRLVRPRAVNGRHRAALDTPSSGLNVPLG